MAFLDKGRGLERKTRKAAQMEGKAPKKIGVDRMMDHF